MNRLDYCGDRLQFKSLPAIVVNRGDQIYLPRAFSSGMALKQFRMALDDEHRRRVIEGEYDAEHYVKWDGLVFEYVAAGYPANMNCGCSKCVSSPIDSWIDRTHY